MSYRRQRTVLAIYGAIVFVAVGLHFGLRPDAWVSPLALGLTFPGAGFLHWAAGDQILVALGLWIACCATFGIALLVWFGTGNILAPISAWVGPSLLAAYPSFIGLEPTPNSTIWPWLGGPAALAACALLWIIKIGERRCYLPPRAHVVSDRTTEIAATELSPEDNERVRLLLDRALQPPNEFQGFEWRDQFQTAAVRYQVNFTAYALALVQNSHAPGSTAYFEEAHRRLLTKIADRRLWRYWGLENAWGNLRLDSNPVSRQNIMYSGFTLLQMVLGNGESLDLSRRGGAWRSYGIEDVAGILEQQYLESRYGLLACEPNWIYPLCNLITMNAIKASDARLGTARWKRLAERFLASLEREATRTDGSFIAFRSSLTGIAPPAPGGIVMQAFPCLFLNALSPEWAKEHWARVRRRLDKGSWNRLFWPVDTGNYGFSRASGYAATAAAAAEMGDSEVAEECFRRLEIECPTRRLKNIAHRSNASLWAHALEVFARSNRTNGFRQLIEHAPRPQGPYLRSAPYPDVQVLHAAGDQTSLDLIIGPGSDRRDVALEIGGLLPGRQYTTGLDQQRFATADDSGVLELQISLGERTSLFIRSPF